MLDLWKRGQLGDAEEALTAAISVSQNPGHHVFASRALVRAHLQPSDEAVKDAEKVFAAISHM